MDDLDLHLALEALRTNPAAHAYHVRITRGMQAIEQGTLTPFERDALHRLIARFPVSMPSPTDPVDALIAAFQAKLPTYDSAAVATAIQHALAQRPATLNGAPVTITMNGDTHAHQANLAIGNQVGGNLVQVTVTIPIPDARFDALLATALKTHEQEKTLARIRHAAQQIESDRLLNLRLQGFVGRVNELAAIREQITAMRPTGGYVLIKAAAGEGKSSSIAKLIQEAGIAQTPHHFIALTTGREYQLGLLRAVVAQLILKHNLTVSYFPEESYPAMKGEFARILDELSKQGISETVYLDGLDQLQPEIDGSRDLSFLPPQPPPGIVIVLGSRPDETLKPLEILHRVDYPLPPLSESDALELWRSVQPDMADGLLHDLYAALKGNALFVHLAADTMQGQSVVDATSLIRQIEQNPSNLFGITLERIKGRSLADWRAIWKPMLALLLVAQEPLRLDVLGNLLGHDHDTMQDAVWVLGGLVSQGIDQRVALHHLLFRDYLAVSVFNQREVKRWHQRLADWCAQDVDVIWTDDRDPIEQARRVYARHHYVAHLALAENWTVLWQVLDAGDYGEQKTRFDPSTRLYALDLDIGRESAIKAGQSIEEQIQNLPRLWKYSLLRTSLNSRVDQWPSDLFVILAMLGRTQEALERIELLSDPLRQISIWKEITRWCDNHYHPIILSRMQQSTNQLLGFHASSSLKEIAKTMASLGHSDQALALLNQALVIIQSVNNPLFRARIFTTIAEIMTSLGQYDQALELINHTLKMAQSAHHRHSARILREIANVMSSFGHTDQALELINQTLAITQSINMSSDHAAYTLTAIAEAITTFGNTDQAVALLNQALNIIQRIGAEQDCTYPFIAIAKVMVTLGDIDQALLIAQAIDTASGRIDAFIAIAKVMVTLGDTNQALLIAQAIDTASGRIDAFIAIAEAMIAIGDTNQALALLNQAVSISQVMDADPGHMNRLMAVVKAMIAIGDTNQVLPLLNQILSLLDRSFISIQLIDTAADRIKAFITIAEAITTLDNTDQALTLLNQATIVAQLIDTAADRIKAFITIAEAMIALGNTDQALTLLNQAAIVTQAIDDNKDRVHTLTAIAEAITTLGNTNQALTLLNQATIVAQAIDTASGRIDAFIIIAEAMIALGNTDQALTLLNQATIVAQSINTNLGPTHTFIAVAKAMATLGDTDQALLIAQAINDNKDRAYTLTAIAKTIAALGDTDQALLIAQAIDDNKDRVHTLTAIAEAITTLGNTDQALTLLNQATIVVQAIDTASGRIDAFIIIAEAMIALGNTDQALTLLNQALSIIQAMDTTSNHVNRLMAIAKAMIAIGDTNQVLPLLNQALKIIQSADKNDPSYNPNTLITIAQTMYSLGYTDQVLSLLNKATVLAQSIAIDWLREMDIKGIIEATASLGYIDQSFILLNQLIATVQSRDDAWMYTETLTAIARATNDLSHIEHMLTITQSIYDEQDRVKTINEILRTVQSVTLIISIIQRELSYSKTLTLTWKSLRLITPLIKLNAWLGLAILKEEAWVNDQLKRLG
ncbi:tetratricopeptide repeat protein [Herpetosiphon llansteffanensis]|uniref:tetratricopeptide repeat protein n=1 Tax=Herpetosiphon llansteffanensis TaxID=2094568 RepID=UPI001F0C1EBD|nr:tetratricopeptide repeat protein [Herpetosiphon llansteffanensis]